VKPLRINWLDPAKLDIRKLDRQTAMRVFDAILHFALHASGDVKPLRGAESWRFAREIIAFCLQSRAARCTFPAFATAPKPTDSNTARCPGIGATVNVWVHLKEYVETLAAIDRRTKDTRRPQGLDRRRPTEHSPVDLRIVAAVEICQTIATQ
jgi:hypothetical protein